MMISEPPRILVVDDDPRICRLLSRYLQAEGFRVETAADAANARELLRARPTDLAILDLKLPGENGLDLAREIRSNSDLPIVVLSGRSDTIDKVVALELGADDYVTKPFEPRELLARIHTILRRASHSSEPTDDPKHRISKFAGWKLDMMAYELSSPAGYPVALTTSEFQLLSVLVSSRSRVLSRDELLDAVNGRDWAPSDRSVDVLVGKLRRKIEADPTQPKLIRTVRNVGYKFAAKVEFV